MTERFKCNVCAYYTHSEPEIKEHVQKEHDGRALYRILKIERENQCAHLFTYLGIYFLCQLDMGHQGDHVHSVGRLDYSVLVKWGNGRG